MKLKIMFFISALTVTMLLFFGLPEQTINARAQQSSMADDVELERSVINELRRIKTDYSRLQSEMVMLKAEMKRRGIVHDTAATGRASPLYGSSPEEPAGITIYLDTSNNTVASSDKELTAVSVRNAGFAEDGSSRAVVSIGKTSVTRDLPEQGRTRYLKARWQ